MVLEATHPGELVKLPRDLRGGNQAFVHLLEQVPSFLYCGLLLGLLFLKPALRWDQRLVLLWYYSGIGYLLGTPDTCPLVRILHASLAGLDLEEALLRQGHPTLIMPVEMDGDAFGALPRAFVDPFHIGYLGHRGRLRLTGLQPCAVSKGCLQPGRGRVIRIISGVLMRGGNFLSRVRNLIVREEARDSLIGLHF